MLVFNEIVFKYIFSNKLLFCGFINLLENECIDVRYLRILFLEPIGFEKDRLQINCVIALYENPNGKSILYCIEYKAKKELLKIIDSMNNDYIYLAKYKNILAARNIKALNLEIKIINLINYIEFKDNLCVRNLYQYKSNFYIIELPKYKELEESVYKDFIRSINLNIFNENLLRSDIVGELARAIEKENKNPRVIRELKQLEESKSIQIIKYQSGYHKGIKDGYEDGYIVAKNEVINEIILALYKERISKHRIAKIVNLSELEVKGIIDNNKKTTFSLNK